MADSKEIKDLVLSDEASVHAVAYCEQLLLDRPNLHAFACIVVTSGAPAPMLLVAIREPDLRQLEQYADQIRTVVHRHRTPQQKKHGVN